MDHRLIEYILTLLNIPEVNREGIDHFFQRCCQEDPDFLKDSPNIFTAYEVIAFLDEMPGGFFIYHADGDEQIIYVNQAVLRIFGCETLQEFQELTGNTFRGFVHQDDLEDVEKSLKEQIAQSQYDLDYVEYRIVRKDGSIRWIEDYGHFVRSQSVGDIFYVFIGDATEKRDRTNRQKEQRMKVIEGLSVNYESILYADLDTDTVLPYRLSTRLETMFDGVFQSRNFQRFASSYVNVWVCREDQEMVGRALSPDYIRERLWENKTYYINYRIMDQGKIQYIQLRIVNVGKTRHVSQIVIGCRIVDQEIREEMEKKRVLEEALNNANLAIVAKNTFLSNMSHDMRTPLNGIFGFTALAKANLHDSRMVERYLDKIETSSRLLLDLIDKVLEISWTESKGIQLMESLCSLSEIVNDVYKSVRAQAEEKQLKITVGCSDLEHDTVYSDAYRLKQFLLCLVSNAVIYTEPRGHVWITVTEEKQLPQGYAVYRFDIEDTGIGISKEFMEHLFEPFEREKNTTFSRVHGTGLGLAIAKSVVDKLEGTIDVESEEGKGSRFSVTLKLRKQEEEAVSSSDFQEIALSCLINQKILLVDDNEFNLEMESEILKELGFEVDIAENGSIAVEMLERSAPGDYQLVLMDIQMPVMNGWEAARAIRSFQDPQKARIPIIALSADAFERDRHKSIENGIDAHLTKPVDIPLLLETYGKIMGNRLGT